MSRYYADHLIKDHYDSYIYLIHLLQKMIYRLSKIKVTKQNKTKVSRLVGNYAATLCKFSHYYQPIFFAYPLKDGIYKYGWRRESLAIEEAPDKHTKKLLENDYHKLPGDTALIVYDTNSSLNGGSVLYIRRLTIHDFMKVAVPAVRTLKNRDF